MTGAREIGRTRATEREDHHAGESVETLKRPILAFEKGKTSI